MAKRRTLLEDEHLGPKIERDMHSSQSTTIGTRLGSLTVSIWPETNTETNTPSKCTSKKYRMIYRLNCHGTSFHLVLVGQSEVEIFWERSPRGPAIPQPQILHELISQTVGLKRVWNPSRQKNQIASQVFLSSLSCEALAKTCFGGECWNQKCELNRPSFYCLVIH